MSDVAIRAENLSKLYRIGERDRYFTLRDTIMNFVRRPLARFSDNGNGVSSSSLAESTIWALKDVSFEVKRGEVVGIIGRNGAGKSTLLKILSRITQPTEGEARIYGRVGSLLEVGTGFHPELTGRENIYLNGAILGMKKAEIDRKFDEIVAFAEVEKFIDTPVKHYSSGMYMRLAFSVAAHLEPEILLMDEVLAVGDIGFQKKCSSKVKEVSAAGRTVMMVSHNIRAIETLCGQCLFLRNGVLEGYGSALDIVRQYQRDSLSDRSRDALPPQFDKDIGEIKVAIQDIALRNNVGTRANSIVPGSSVCLSFNLESIQDIPNAVVCVYFCKDGLLLTGNNSDHMLRDFSMRRGEKVRIDIRYESVPLIPGDYTILIFVLPSYFASPSASLSKFHTMSMVVEGSRRHGGGYVCLNQEWRVAPAETSWAGNAAK